jgi:hypothetical protein
MRRIKGKQPSRPPISELFEGSARQMRRRNCEYSCYGVRKLIADIGLTDVEARVAQNPL